MPTRARRSAPTQGVYNCEHWYCAIGSALAAGQALIEANAIEGTRKVIDLSADSAYSGGGVPILAARAAALAAGITINGLAVLCRHCESGRPIDYDLEEAFTTFIVGGPGHFVVTADGSASFATAVRRKLLLEVAGGPSLRLGSRDMGSGARILNAGTRRRTQVTGSLRFDIDKNFVRQTRAPRTGCE